MLLKSSKICLFAFFICVTASAQMLLVREVRCEPSIGGMRSEADKLSPDNNGRLLVERKRQRAERICMNFEFL